MAAMPDFFKHIMFPMRFRAMVLVSLALGTALLTSWQETVTERRLGTCELVKFHGYMWCGGKDLLLGDCFVNQVRVELEWIWTKGAEVVHFLESFWMILLVCCIILAPALYFSKAHFGSADARYELLSQLSDEEQLDDVLDEELVSRRRAYASKEYITYTAMLWMADMASDIYVIVTYINDQMYFFGALLAGIWVVSGAVAFIHRYLSWQRCEAKTNSKYWATGLDSRGEKKPGFVKFVSYILQVEPLFIAAQAWKHGSTRDLEEERALTALCEGTPSSLLQLYALLVREPSGNLFFLSLSIVLSISTIANGVNKSFGLCLEGKPVIPAVLPSVALTVFRFCDIFAHIALWALLGRCLRPVGAELHGIQQPYLPLILIAEFITVATIFKFTLRLGLKDMFEKHRFLGIINSFLGTWWCCYKKDLVAQPRFARLLLALRTLQFVSVSFGTMFVFSASLEGQCIVANHPAVVVILTLTIFTFLVTLALATAHEISFSCYLKPLFPVVAGWKGGELELAARLDSASLMSRLNEQQDGDPVAALCHAAEDGHINVIRKLFDLRVQLDSRCGDDDQTAAHCAAKRGQVEVLTFLKEHGCNLEATDNKGYTPAHCAAMNDHFEILKLLHDSGNKLEATDNDEATPALIAARHGHLGVMEFLHEIGCNLEARNNKGVTPALLAASYGHLHLLEFLTAAGCSLETAAKTGSTPAFIAAQNGQLGVLQFLHKNGCNLQTPNKYGVTPALIAALNGHIEVLKLLKSAGCNLETADEDGFTPAFVAAAGGHVQVLEFLHENQCGLETPNNLGVKPAWIAAGKGHLEVLKFLHRSGCQLDPPDKNGTTPARAAAANGHHEVVHFLILGVGAQ